ncbi:MAG TPA: GGDEF domain-containing protein, partial [Candidatus Izemoplasmatales bacterium]|nr:GGDEF domain-containing protein [Candidatus Izemoplasmatales bacterium]
REMLAAIIDMQPFSFTKGIKHYVLETISLISPISRSLKGYMLKFNETTTFVDKIEKLDYQASHDELTKILNRRAFHEKAREYLAGMNKRHAEFSIIYMDIDDFKSINDTYSHMAGDYVLKTFAETIFELLPDDSLFARYGGEEFVVLLKNISREDAIAMAQGIRIAAMKKEYSFEGKKIDLKVSLGLYNHSGSKPIDIYDLIFLADKALYRSKNTGKNKLTVYEPDENEMV